MNGVPMAVRTIQSRLEPAALFDYYEAQARGSGRNEYRRSNQGEWLLLAIKAPSLYTTFQLRRTVAGCEGTITSTPLPIPPATGMTSEFPRPSTSRIVSLQEYEDAGVRSEHISLLSTHSAAVEARAFAEQLSRLGWSILRHESMQQVAAGFVIEAQHGAQQAMLTLQPDRLQATLTAIVVVWSQP